MLRKCLDVRYDPIVVQVRHQSSQFPAVCLAQQFLNALKGALFNLLFRLLLEHPLHPHQQAVVFYHKFTAKHA